MFLALSSIPWCSTLIFYFLCPVLVVAISPTTLVPFREASIRSQDLVCGVLITTRSLSSV